MGRIVQFGYGVLCYLLFFGTFLYAIGFLANLGVPWTIDSGEVAPLGEALLVNLTLLSVFALQHSGMARPAFKRWWARIVPPAIERNTYVLFSSLGLWLVFAFWRPMPEVIWQLESGVGYALLSGGFVLGLGLVLYSTCLIDHFELFGLRQALANLRGRRIPEHGFVTPSLYRVVRHPIYVGWFVTFWATPTMSAGHLLFASVCSAYIVAAVQLEERDLLDVFGDTYARYRARVPAFLPLARARGNAVALES